MIRNSLLCSIISAVLFAGCGAYAETDDREELPDRNSPPSTSARSRTPHRAPELVDQTYAELANRRGTVSLRLRELDHKRHSLLRESRIGREPGFVQWRAQLKNLTAKYDSQLEAALNAAPAGGRKVSELVRENDAARHRIKDLEKTLNDQFLRDISRSKGQNLLEERRKLAATVEQNSALIADAKLKVIQQPKIKAAQAAINIHRTSYEDLVDRYLAAGSKEATQLLNERAALKHEFNEIDGEIRQRALASSAAPSP